MIKPDSFTVKRPLITIILIELMLMIFVAGGSAYVSIAELTHPLAPFLGFIPIALFLLIYLSVKKRWSIFYFSSLSKLTKRQWLEYLPLLLVLIVLVIGNKGFQPESFSFFAYLLLSQIFLVGFVEETLFRGIILRILMPKGKAFAIVVSSALFGITHALQALSGQSLEDTILQIVYAFILGFVLTMLVVRNRAIFLTILFHGLHNFLNFTGNTPSTHLYDYLVLTILLAQLLWLLSSSKKSSAASDGIYA
ncbi:CPBP family intramembrane glutamic endopeptidase [Paenibacillus luteus]|uniref:CPBP family intramembrane glutamic endopeptidase n=1 Tax=Paenibacillus luteus TaxID=2545753 RepID=UPI001142A5E8|nr:CPBP family intramembrane glutamic endopeptidase [Paenibacillus luteus]